MVHRGMVARRLAVVGWCTGTAIISSAGQSDAQANCDIESSVYLCTGSGVSGVGIADDDVSVVATDGFAIDTRPGNGGRGGNALTIEASGSVDFGTRAGNGDISLSSDQTVLRIGNQAQAGQSAATTIVARGDFLGATGIAVESSGGTGGLDFQLATGSVSASGNAIELSRSSAEASAVRAEIARKTRVSAEAVGMTLVSSSAGTGGVDLTVGGTVQSQGSVAVATFVTNGDLQLRTLHGSAIQGPSGVFAQHVGTGSATLDFGGDLLASGLFALDLSTGQGSGPVSLLIRDGARVTGQLGLVNRGTGDTTIDLQGTVLADRIGDAGLRAR